MFHVFNPITFLFQIENHLIVLPLNYGSHFVLRVNLSWHLGQTFANLPARHLLHIMLFLRLLLQCVDFAKLLNYALLWLHLANLFDYYFYVQ